MPFNMTPWQLFAFLGIPAVSDLAGTAIASRGASKASETQVEGAERAAEISRATTKEALDLQREIYRDQTARLEPYRQGGEAAYGRLMGASGLPVPARAQPPGISAPSTGADLATQRPWQPQQGPSGGPSWLRGAAGTGVSIGTGLALSKLGGGATAPAWVNAPAYGVAPKVGAAVAEAGGGFGSTLAGLATNPLTIGASGAALVGAAWLKSQAHWEANDIVQNYQNPFHHKFLAPLMEAVRTGKADPQQALQALDENWNQYRNATKQWAGDSSDRNTVFNQSLETLTPIIAELRQEIEAKAGTQTNTGQTIDLNAQADGTDGSFAAQPSDGTDGSFAAQPSDRDRLLAAAARYRRT